ncbi:MAG: hypothetical protein ACPGVT_05360 [Maricaulaceae bacterium]
MGKHRKQNKLCDLYKIGFHNDWSQTAVSDYQGDFICTLLGYLFRVYRMKTPQLIKRDDNRFYHYLDENNVSYCFQRVANEMLIISETGERQTLAIKSASEFSILEMSITADSTNAPELQSVSARA